MESSEEKHLQFPPKKRKKYEKTKQIKNAIESFGRENIIGTEEFNEYLEQDKQEGKISLIYCPIKEKIGEIDWAMVFPLITTREEINFMHSMISNCQREKNEKNNQSHTICFSSDHKVLLWSTAFLNKVKKYKKNNKKTFDEIFSLYETDQKQEAHKIITYFLNDMPDKKFHMRKPRNDSKIDSKKRSFIEEIFNRCKKTHDDMIQKKVAKPDRKKVKIGPLSQSKQTLHSRRKNPPRNTKHSDPNTKPKTTRK